jgi:hypothetical protein
MGIETEFNQPQFLGSMGLLSVLLLNKDGLLRFDPLPLTTIADQQVRIPHEERSGTQACFLGVGCLGSQIASILRRTSEVRPTSTSGRQLGGLFPLQECQFESDACWLTGALGDYDWIFLAGSLDDPAFWMARKLALSLNPFFLTTLVTNTGMILTETVQIKPAKNESIILFEGSSSAREIATTIEAAIPAAPVKWHLTGI